MNTWIFGRVRAAGLFTAMALATGTIAAGAAAQTAGAQDGASQGTATVRLAPVSVTATRGPVETFSYPGMVTVVGAEEIDRLTPSSPDDILRWVPGVEFTGGPRRTGETPSIRGFSGPDVVVLIDGARQNFESGHDGRFFIDPSLLREVEVLRGPASALYGSGGTGGVIEFRTKRAEDLLAPGETAGLRVSGGFQTANHERLGAVTAFARPTEEVDVLTSFALRKSGSINLGDGSQLDQSDDDIVSGLAKLGVELTAHQAVEASFQRFANTAQEPNNGQSAGGDEVEKEITADTWRLAYRYDNPDDPLFDVDASVYHTAFTADELRLDSTGGGPVGEVLKRDVDTLGFRLDNRSRLALTDDAFVTFTYGAEGYRDEQDGGAGGAERGGVPDAEAEFSGLYGQAQVSLLEPFGVLPGELRILPGLRYDSYTSSSAIAADNSDDALSPRLGVSYLPTEWSLLFANYAHAFRAPTINELYTTGVHFQIPVGAGITNRFVSNPNLQPQTTETFEVGGGLDFDSVVAAGDRAQVKVSHYVIHGEDFIDLQVDQPTMFVDCNPFIPGACDGTTRSVNVADAKLRGTEVEGSYENDRVRLGLGLSTIDGENQDTGAKLGVLTPTELTVQAALKLPEVDSVVGWRMLAAGEFTKVNSAADERDGFAVHDVWASWRPADLPVDGLEVTLGVQNVFDKAYARVATDALEPGRNVTALVSYGLSW